MDALVILTGQQKNTYFPLAQRKSTIVGRDPSMDFQIADPTVSRKHAKVELNAATNKFHIRPLKSSDHMAVVMVNEESIDISCELSDGDIIVLGNTIIKFTSHLAEGSDNALYQYKDPGERYRKTVED